MKYYGIYNKKFDMYVSKFVEDGCGTIMTNGFNDICVFGSYEDASDMLGRIPRADDYEVREISDRVLVDDGISSPGDGIMSTEELPGLCAMLKRWELTLILCAISGIMDGDLGVAGATGIKAEADKAGAVRAFIEKKLGVGEKKKK